MRKAGRPTQRKASRPQNVFPVFPVFPAVVFEAFRFRLAEPGQFPHFPHFPLPLFRLFTGSPDRAQEQSAPDQENTYLSDSQV
jgi:hypothetical protein